MLRPAAGHHTLLLLLLTLSGARQRNVTKAGLLYDTIAASNGFYFSPVEESARSKMNVPFTIPSKPDLEKTLVAGELSTVHCVGIALVFTSRSCCCTSP